MGKIAVFGGAGFGGSVLVNQLLNRHYKVKVLDNLYKSGKPLIQYGGNPNFEFVYGDTTNKEDVVKFLDDDIDGILLLAAIVGAPSCAQLPSLAHAVNVEGTRNVVNAKRDETPLFLTSTGSVYGKVEDVCTEESPTNPLSVYGITKLLSEQIVLEKPNTIVYRYSTAAGISPAFRINLLPNEFVWRGYHEKSLTVFQADFKRSFVSIQDMMLSLIYGIENFNLMYDAYRVYNVGDSEANWTKRELAEYVKNLTHCYVNFADSGYVDPDQRSYHVSFDRIYSVGWRPSQTMDETMNQLYRTVPLIRKMID